MARALLIHLNYCCKYKGLFSHFENNETRSMEIRTSFSRIHGMCLGSPSGRDTSMILGFAEEIERNDLPGFLSNGW
jgi:hypothetical protein